MRDGYDGGALAAMKAPVEQVREEFAFSQRRSCGLLLVPVSSFCYRPRRNDAQLYEQLIEQAREKPRFKG